MFVDTIPKIFLQLCDTSCFGPGIGGREGQRDGGQVLVQQGTNRVPLEIGRVPPPNPLPAPSPPGPNWDTFTLKTLHRTFQQGAK